jgi:hypothetical protein
VGWGCIKKGKSIFEKGWVKNWKNQNSWKNQFSDNITDIKLKWDCTNWLIISHLANKVLAQIRLEL